MFLSSGVTFLLRAWGGARVDVDSIKGCGFTSCLTQPLIHDPEHDLRRSRLQMNLENLQSFQEQQRKRRIHTVLFMSVLAEKGSRASIENDPRCGHLKNLRSTAIAKNEGTASSSPALLRTAGRATRGFPACRANSPSGMGVHHELAQVEQSRRSQ